MYDQIEERGSGPPSSPTVKQVPPGPSHTRAVSIRNVMGWCKNLAIRDDPVEFENLNLLSTTSSGSLTKKRGVVKTGDVQYKSGRLEDSKGCQSVVLPSQISVHTVLYVVGEVIKLGPDITSFKVGDKVFGWLNFTINPSYFHKFSLKDYNGLKSAP